MANIVNIKTTLGIYPQNSLHIPTDIISKNCGRIELFWDIVDFFDKLSEVHFCITDNDELNFEFSAFERDNDEISWNDFPEDGVAFEPAINSQQELVGIRFILGQDFLDKLYVNKPDDKLVYFIKLIYKDQNLPVEIKRQAYILVVA